MGLLIVILIILVLFLGLKYLLNVDLTVIKKLAKNDKLDKLIDKFPNNVEICKKILALIGNDKVKIEEDKKSTTSLYLVMNNKIVVGDIKGYTRVQTIAHECIHSMQDKNLLWANFIISNLFLLYFIVSLVLTIFGVFKDTMLQVEILTLFAFTAYLIRSYLETDAIIKARYLAREYMKREKILKPEEMAELLETYDILNKYGVKAMDYRLMLLYFVKVLIYAIVAYIFGGIL